MKTPTGDSPPGDARIESLDDISGMSGSLSQRVYTGLRNAILDLRLPPGSVLRKAALCQQLGVSRSPVAEAITLLSAEGLVDVIPQSATRVARFSLSEIREESFLREAIEVAAVSRVASARSEDQLAQLSRNVHLQRLLVADRDFHGFFDVDEEFHALLLAFTGYRKVAEVAAQIALQVRRARILLLPEDGRPEATVAEHEAILEAIRDRDPIAAADAIRAHLAQLISRIEPLETTHPSYFRAARAVL